MATGDGNGLAWIRPAGSPHLVHGASYDLPAIHWLKGACYLIAGVIVAGFFGQAKAIWGHRMIECGELGPDVRHLRVHRVF